MNNNKGFSMVELLISISILAIIIIPIAGLFISSSRILFDSMELSETNLITENIAEQIESHDFDDWLRGKSPFILKGMGADNSDIQGRYFAYHGDNYHESDFRQTAPPYDIVFNGVEGEYSTYRATVSLTKDSNSSINEKELFTNVPIDYMSVQSREAHQDNDQLSYEAFLIEAATLGYNISDPLVFKERLTTKSRQITVDIAKLANGNTSATLKYQYTYNFPAPNADEDIEAGIANTFFNWPKDTDSISLTPSSGAEFDDVSKAKTNFYILFYPWYNSQDKIVINNTSKVPTSVALIKQVDAELTESELQAYETNYTASVTLNEPKTNNKYETDVITNLDKNLTGAASTQIVSYNASSGSFTPIQIGDGEKEDRLFNVTITLYDEADLKTPIKVLNSSILD